MPASHVFAIPGASWAIDTQHPGTGLSRLTGDTLDQVRARYPGAELMTFEAFCTAAEAPYLAQAPQAIDARAWQDLLGCMPPMHWHGDSAAESFQMGEHTSGRITTAAVRLGEAFYTVPVVAGTRHADIVARVSRHLASETS